MIPDVNALDRPDFADAEHSVLADDIKELKFGYYGVNTGAAVDEAPTWRDEWDDPQLLPQLIRVDVTPEKGFAWPTLVIAPREAPEAGCRNWNATPSAARRCDDARRCPQPNSVRSPPARHRARARAMAHRHAHGDRQRLCVFDAQRGARRTQHDFARAGACGCRRRDPAHGFFEVSRNITPDTWKRDGTVHTWRDGEITLAASATDESAKIDLNVAKEALLRSLFVNVGGTDPDRAAQITDAIFDWRDADDLARPNGAEEADYRAAGLKYKPANAPFETVTELARVKGVTAAIYARVADSLTVHSRQAGINPSTASRNVLLALPNTTPDAVDAYLALRGEALKANQPVPPFPPAQGFTAGPGPVWRVHALATMADGVTFAREAVVNPSGDMRRPLVALAWARPGQPTTPGNRRQFG